MRRRHLAYWLSGLCVLASIASLVIHGGPRYGVDFAGGTLLEISVVPPPTVDAVREAVDEAGFRGSEIQRMENPGQFLIRLGAEVGHKDPAPLIRKAILAAHPGSRVETLRVEAVGPRVGGELRGAALNAVSLALGLIL